MENCIFCKIVAGEVPAAKVYEDEHTLAFLDRAPVTLGHTLVIPKKHAVNIFDVDEETLMQTMHTVRKIAPAVRDAAGASGMHIQSNHESTAGQDVFHLHFHLIPRRDGSTFELWPKVAYAEGEKEKILENIKKALDGK